jgi:two-component sensor histidine kinase
MPEGRVSRIPFFSLFNRAATPANAIADPAADCPEPDPPIVQPGKLADGSVPAAKPYDDTDRVGQLRHYCILDTGKDARFDRLTTLTAQLLDVPIVLVSLVDESREWFKSTVGTGIAEIKREHGFCAHALLLDGPTPLTVGDALLDGRFATHPFVVGGPKLRFYAGAPLISANGHKIGMLCVHDVKPRPDFGAKQEHILSQLAGIVMDEIDFHRIESERSLLVGELSHRVKNLIGVVSSVAKLSARGNPEAQPFLESFSSRLVAMSTAHDKLVAGDWKGADLRDVVASVVAAHLDINETSIVLDIPSLVIDASFAQTFALLVHELLTNAIKYGALKGAAGRVTFSATRAKANGGSVIEFEWRETGGPPAVAPQSPGFGHRLLDMAVRQKGGTVKLDWKPEGLVCRFTFAE